MSLFVKIIVFITLCNLYKAEQWLNLPQAPWTRSSFRAVEFKDEILISGGWSEHATSGSQSIWSSPDGLIWRKLTPDTHMGLRTCYPTADLNGTLYSMGGCNGPNTRFNDVWTSSDGAVWTQINADSGWSTRCCFPAVAFEGRLFIFGGHDMLDYRNDVWVSEDGLSWKELTQSAEWSPRDASQALVFKGYLWILGGHDGSKGIRQWHNDVWRSKDGRIWECVTNEAPWPRRSGFAATIWGEQMIIMGGWSNNQLLNDVWASSDGKTWIQLQTAIWSPRWWFAGLTFQNEVYVLGGNADTYSYVPLSDVYKLTNSSKWKNLN